MPPPQGLRCSPRRSPGTELRGESHKRGRSLESGLSFKGKEDDGLALFDEMQKKEHDTFLLEANDDFEDLFGTRMKYFSDCPKGLSVSTTRGGTSDMLNADGEKNDYDWLLTPPDTPLFPSLDDEAPPGNLVQRGRPRSLPIAISRSSTNEKNYKGRSGRGSPSPQRFSPSPRPGTGSSHQSRGRTSPAPSSSPTQSIRSSSPSRKHSPPSVKPLTSGPRSSTPTPRRLSTGSSGIGASSHTRGSSPVQSSRGISSSPKVSAWQSNIPGFSTEVPPNLRTSLADRPATYVRGSSPASQYGKDLPVKVKLSMSPTDHKSITSSVSHDRDWLSSHSKVSMISCGDDDAESMQSIPLSTSDSSRRVGTQSNKNAIIQSRKPNKMVLSSSAPKRSFDNALRHMDQRKTPQNMFRPLLSSVPSTALYVGKPMSAREAMLSKNSSMATSSTASSELEGIYAHPNTATQYEDKPVAHIPEEVFLLDRMDGLHSDAGTEICSRKIQHGVVDEVFVNATEHDDDEHVSYSDSETALGAVTKTKSKESYSLEDESLGDMTHCSECGGKYSSIDSALSEVNLCPECWRKNSNLQVCYSEKSVSEVYPGTEPNHPDKHSPQNEKEKYLSSNGCVDLTSKTESTISQCEDISVCHSSGQPTSELRGPFMLGSDASSSYFNDSEVDGISILLKRSSSSKGSIYQGRMFKASSVAYDDPSYVRESGSFSRSSMGLGSTSVSSSVDLSSNRQMETLIKRQSSTEKIEVENCRHKRSESHSSETSNRAYQASCLSLNMHDDDSEAGGGYEYNVEESSCLREQFHTSGSTDIHEIIASRTSSFQEIPESSIISGGSSVTSHDEKPALYEHGEAIEKIHFMTDINALTSESQPVEDLPLQQKNSDGEKGVKVCTHRSLHSVSEIENELDLESNHDSDNDYSSTKLDAVLESHMLSAATSPDKTKDLSVKEDDRYINEHGVSESTVVIQSQRGSHVRSLTLEEATDTILFCRSLVQNIVDQAATIAIEKEKHPHSEPPRPILAKTNPHSGGRTPNYKPTLKSKKPKRTRTEDPKLHASEFENDENTEQSFPRNIGPPNKPDAARPPKLESKCNCTIM